MTTFSKARFSFILLIFFSGILLNNCSKEEVKPSPTPAATPDPAPAVLNKPIVDTITPGQNETIDIFGTVTVKFHQAINRAFILQNIKYKPVLESIAIQGVSTQLVWNKDSTQVTFKHGDALSPKSQFTIKIVSHWALYKNNVWQVVNWQTADLREIKESSFNTGDGKATIDATNIKYAYPIPNQYHFFPKEYSQGFLRLINGQSYLFTDSGFDTWVEFQTSSSSITQSIAYDINKNQITYSIPNGLLNETIYTTSFKRKNKSTGEVSVIHQYAFRTSKYNTFAEKVNSFDLTATVLRGLQIPWRVHYLKHDFKSGEYFDDFELETKTDTVKYANIPYKIPYVQIIRFA